MNFMLLLFPRPHFYIDSYLSGRQCRTASHLLGRMEENWVRDERCGIKPSHIQLRRNMLVPQSINNVRILSQTNIAEFPSV
ncbi:hypothetical protein GGP41_000378 [Bipolaris sorokiniana]|uniref:Uncharacterized protein n=1 Tax=Cochliobolus sativus TaxID=45130 RepID=A0A8H6DT87_COCSA|nr:hypothetical protein GGP41_000378 [Bipolaris sorokiniana]